MPNDDWCRCSGNRDQFRHIAEGPYSRHRRGATGCWHNHSAQRAEELERAHSVFLEACREVYDELILVARNLDLTDDVREALNNAELAYGAWNEASHRFLEEIST